MIIGYARTSTTDQKAGLEAQLRDLKDSGCEKTFVEEVSSVDIANRVQLEGALEFAREGDVLVVTKLDRLARSVAHLLKIVEAIEAKGASLRILDLAIDTGTPTGRLMLTMIGGIAQFEREIMLERQREGIAKAARTLAPLPSSKPSGLVREARCKPNPRSSNCPNWTLVPYATAKLPFAQAGATDS